MRARAWVTGWAVGALLGCGAKPPAAPTALTVVSAGTTQVGLSWTASPAKGVTGYVLERADAGDTAFIAIGTAPGTTASDTTVDPNSGYAYQVRAVAGGARSDPSNVVQAGPPPKPFSVAAAAPAGANPSSFGAEVSFALDGNGDPAVAYDVLDPSNAANNALFFTPWSRTQYAWGSPLNIGLVGPVDTDAGQKQVSLARDPASGAWGIAYQTLLDANDANHEIKYAFLADGGSWSVKNVPMPMFGTPPNPVSSPQLLLAGGQAYLLFQRGNDGLRYMSGPEGADPAIWTTALAPTTDPSSSPVALPAGFALDSSGKTGVAYWVTATAGPGLALLFWRPGTFTPNSVTDTGVNAEPAPSVGLAFFGTEARVAFGAVNAAGAFPMGATRSADGMTWSPVVTLSPDGPATKGPQLALALGSKGQAAVSYAGGAGGTCGNPKLALSPDFSAWTTCSPVSSVNAAAASPAVAYGVNDQLIGAFQALDGSVTGAPGVVVWRQ